MKITVFLILVAIMQTFAVDAIGQRTKLTLKLNSTSIVDVLEQIENQTDIHFFYQSEDLKGKDLLNVDIENKSVSEVLDIYLPRLNLKYETFDKYIAISSVDENTENSVVQSKKVTGKVVDSYGQPLPGVSIIVKGTTQGTITDFDGNYTLPNVADDATLIFSFVGMKSIELAVAGKSIIEVEMKDDAIGLEEVVAIGYGTAKKRDITGSVGSVSAERLNASPITSLDAGLQGKIAGVTVQQTSGAPGQSMKIRIRGGSSINYSNNPLYVIDGFIGADISTINPNDIATIDILKDASATAVYGSRGANGVVLITTNAPTKGKFKISLDANYGVSNMVNTYERLTPVEQMELMNIQDIAGGKSPAFTEAQINEYRNGKQGTDWIDLLTRPGSTQNYTLNATGGNDNMQYYFSANHMDEQGIIENTFYKRTSLRSNIKAKISDKVDLVFNTYGVHVDSQGNNAGTNGMGNPIGIAAVYPQLWDARDANGEIIDPNTYSNFNGTYQVGQDGHPEQRIRQNQENFNDRIISNLDLTFDLGYNLTLLISNSGSYQSAYDGSRTLEAYVTTSRDNITARQHYARNVRWLNTDILSYENDFGKHHVKASAVYEYSKSINRGITGNVGTLSTLANEWYLLSNGQPTSLTSNYNETTMRSYMGRINYSYADKYLLTASMRADGTSVFNSDNRWGYFPSAALAWRASEEGFIKDLGWVHNLKVRAGFGTTGNTAVGPYETLPTINATPGANASYYPIYGDLISGIRPGPLTDADLKWETTIQYNFGVDFSMLNGRLSAVLDLYSKQTTDVIIAKSVPRYTGYEAYTDNFADIDNKGLELGIDWNVMDKGDFTWDVNFVFSKNVNEVKSLGDDVDEIFIADEEPLGVWSLVGGNSKFIVREGEPMGSMFGLNYLGLWQLGEETEAAKFNSKPGEPKYEDLDGDGSYSASDRQIIGTAAPDFAYGLSTSLAYKGFDLSIQCIGSQGNDIYNFADNIMTQQARILSADYRDRWTPENPNATHQTMPVGNDYSMTYIVGQYVEDGSFFKVSNATLGYTLPKSVTNNLGLGNVRVYMSADNLLTITNYSGLDPEGSSTPANSDSQAGIDAFSYPLTRTVMGGIKINF